MTKKTKLELTWPGKEDRPRLEPRILLENPDLSYSAKGPGGAQGPGATDNLLIKGDNLLALKALEADYAGRVKCVYIDPPFNTGAAMPSYEDGLEHSIWLSLMHQRLTLIRELLTEDGAIFIHLDDNELDYCKVIMDEIFGRANFINRIAVEARAPSAFSTVNPGVFKASEYILWYSKDRSKFAENSGRVKREPDYAYNKWLKNPDDKPEDWCFEGLAERYEREPAGRSKHPRSILEKFNTFIVDNADRVCRLASISDSGAGKAILGLKAQSARQPEKVIHMSRDGGLDDVYVLNGQQLIFYKKNVVELDGVKSASKLLTNIWTDIAWEGIAAEGGVRFPKGKKPERLIRRCIELTTNPGDLVLDSFAGSGTTGAVAQKMGRRWIMVEIGDHADTHIVPRLKQVIDGSDGGGISKAVEWQGGGAFRYCTLAPSLLAKDRWGNWVVAKEYDGNMLAAAMCRHLGFAYAPSSDPAEYWRHGQSSETDFLYVTTQSLTRDALKLLSEEVGAGRTLKICAPAFSRGFDDFANLSCAKIPAHILSRCEWGRDDYSLNVTDPTPADEVEEEA